jgi:hypothetical protein
MYGKRTAGGHYATNQVQRKIRRLAKQALRNGDDNIVIVSTPYTD